MQQPDISMPAMGGTQILSNRMKESGIIPDEVNILYSGCFDDWIKDGKKNLLWEHHNFLDPSVRGLAQPEFQQKLDSIVYVSNWQSEKYTHILQIPPHFSKVIRNSIDPIELIQKPKNEKIKLIYHTTPWRGLEVLLDAFEILNRDDVELDIYSSTIIYGSEYDEVMGPIFKKMFDRAKSMKNVNYIGYATHDDVVKAVQSAHIFAYPSTWMETSCVAMIEAGAAGCNIVSTNFGALPETSIGFGNLLQIQSDMHLFAKRYANALNECIDNYWSQSNQDMLKYQSEAFNYHYSWEKIKPMWVRHFEDVINKDKYEA